MLNDEQARCAYVRLTPRHRQSTMLALSWQLAQLESVTSKSLGFKCFREVVHRTEQVLGTLWTALDAAGQQTSSVSSNQRLRFFVFVDEAQTLFS